MPRKKSIKRAANAFIDEADGLTTYVETASQHFSDEYISWSYDYAIIRLYRCFESLMLEVLVGTINNDTTTIKSTTGFTFPKHLTNEVCRYLVVGDGYFDFKGRDGLIKLLLRFIPNDHYLQVIS